MQQNNKRETNNKQREPTAIEKYRFIFLALFVTISGLLSFFSVKIMPPLPENFAANAASAAIAALIVLAVYAITRKATENAEAALFAAALSAPIQLFTWKTVSQMTHTLAVFFFLLTILAFLYLKEVGDWKLLILIPVAFSFVHIYSLAMIPIYLLYILFVKLEQKEVSQAEMYFMVASTAFILGIFALFKASPALLLIISEYAQNNYYSIAAENFALKRAFALAGAIPIYLGFFGAYESLIRKRKSALVLLAGLLTFFVAMLFNIIPAGLGVPYFTLALACLAGFLYYEIHNWLQATRFKPHAGKIFMAVIAVLLALGILHRIIFLST